MTLRANATTQQVKTCSKCRLEKPVSEFQKRVASSDELTARCKLCLSIFEKTIKRRAARSARHNTVKERHKTNERHRLKNGFSIGDFEAALLLQQGKCAICRHLFTPQQLEPSARYLKQKNKPCADHDHTTKKPRGVLCVNCNVGLGNFKDSPALLEAAIAYLRNPPLDLV